jgi:hypothetical protein
MRINEEFIEDISTGDIMMNDAQEVYPDSYDAVVLFIILTRETTPLYNKIHKVIKASPNISRADVLPTETMHDNDRVFINISVGYKTYVYDGDCRTNNYLAYGFNGNLKNIRRMLKLFINLNKWFPEIIDAVSVFDTSESN